MSSVSEYLDFILVWCKGQNKYPLVIGVLVILCTSPFIKSIFVKRRLSLKRRQKKERCNRAIQELENQLSDDTLSPNERSKITKLDTNELTEMLQNGKLNPTQVLEAYQGKALEVNKRTNCIIEPITEAKKQSESLCTAGRKGLLYGIPVSVKDNFGVTGYDGDVGIARWIDKPYTDDAVIVKVLKSEGAIPFVKTNVPQTMISFETTNPIHGATVNPHDVTRGVGGSSGGEGALIAGGGSILGFGSDIGGSIRIPAHMCGVCGLKPTAHRLSPKGTAPLLKGQSCVPAAYGPLARDVDAVILAMKALLVPKMFELDAQLPHLPFRNEIFKSEKPLRIGYFLYDGYFRAIPAIERGVLEAKAILEKRGHELVEWHYEDLSWKATGYWGKALFGDGGEELSELLSGDAVDSSFITVSLALSLPHFVKNILYYLMKPFVPKIARLLTFLQGQKSVRNWWELQKDVDEFRESVAADWQQKGFDAVICPGLGSTALPFGQSAMAQGVTSYTMLFNVLNFPAGSLPVTKVTKADVDDLVNYPTSDPWYIVVKKGMKGSEGLPVNIQVAALPWQEETILRVMKEVETSIKEGN